MRILYFSPRNFWPLDSGANLRDYYLLRESASRASVTFLGITNGDESGQREAIPEFGLQKSVLAAKGKAYTSWKLLRGFVGPTPVNVLNYYHPRIAHALRQLLDQNAFDVVQMEGLHLASYLPIIRATHSRPKVICDWHDVPSELVHRYSEHAKSRAQRLYATRTARLLSDLEHRMVPLYDANLVVSERDQEKFREFAPKARVHVVENGVDVTSYRADEKQTTSATREAQDSQSRNNIIFVGSMDSPANIDGAKYFALEVWPKIQASIPDCRFLIVGSRPTTEVRELAKLPGITVTGTVESVLPYYRNALAAVVPIRIAGGTRLKILEAMAAQVPVVSTRVGAEGLAVNQGRDILIADTHDEMAIAVQKLSKIPDERRRLCEAGHQLVRARYDWSVIGGRLHEIHCALLGVN